MRITTIKADRVELPPREGCYRREPGVEPLAEVPAADGIG
jgi:hypothetical protein